MVLFDKEIEFSLSKWEWEPEETNVQNSRRGQKPGET